MPPPAKPRGLGRGLDALFTPAPPPPAAPETRAPTPDTGDRATSSTDLGRVAPRSRAERSGVDAFIAPIEQLHPNRTQPRTQFEEKALEELAASMREVGVLEPILVRRRAAGGYEIVAGERRWRAAQRAGLHEVPVLSRELSDRAGPGAEPFAYEQSEAAAHRHAQHVEDGAEASHPARAQPVELSTVRPMAVSSPTRHPERLSQALVVGDPGEEGA
jgi:hypothetical protein